MAQMRLDLTQRPTICAPKLGRKPWKAHTSNHCALANNAIRLRSIRNPQVLSRTRYVAKGLTTVLSVESWPNNMM